MGGEAGCASGPDSDDARLVAALRRGDEAVFVQMIERYQSSLIRMAMLYVADWDTAEEVVQETWLGVLRGIDRFEGHSSIKTWIVGILTNRAKRRGQREKRSVPFSLAWISGEDDEPAVPASRFEPPGHRWAGHWVAPPSDWAVLPEEMVLAQEVRETVERVIAALPPAQREVITLRDIEGWPAVEVCQVLQLTEVNQRVLLHRARAKVRQALEQHFGE